MQAAVIISRRTLRALPSPRISLCSIRSIYSTQTLQKPKPKKGRVAEVEEFEDDFWTDPEESIPVKGKSLGAAVDSVASPKPVPVEESAAVAAAAEARDRLSLARRKLRFDTLFAFVTERLGRKPLIRSTEISGGAWVNLFDLASSPAELETVVELMPQWRDTHGKKDSRLRRFKASDALRFAVRCNHLHCPEIALKVFGDYGKYTLGLTLPAARELLDACRHRSTEAGDIQGAFVGLRNALTASALYPIHQLMPATSDATSCALLLVAASRCQSIKLEDPVEPAVIAQLAKVALLSDKLLAVLEAQLPLKSSDAKEYDVGELALLHATVGRISHPRFRAWRQKMRPALASATQPKAPAAAGQGAKKEDVGAKQTLL